MADEEHVGILRGGVGRWNLWRETTRGRPNLGRADLAGLDLGGADLSSAHLTEAILADARLVDADLRDSILDGANLERAHFFNAKLSGASLRGAVLYRAHLVFTKLNDTNLTGANLASADMTGADLTRGNLSESDLRECIFRESILSRTNFEDALLLGGTVFLNTNLAAAIGLERCRHQGRSSVDFASFELSGSLPLLFLRGIGLQNIVIDYLPSLLSQPIQHYSCFISYSTKDNDFVQGLYGDLQEEDVRCWFAPHDMPIGGKIWDEIDSAIRLRDKVLLILSEHSIKSDWVEDEVTKAFEEERKHNKLILFPIRLDDAVMETNEAWAAKLRARHIGDFRRWKDHDEYQKSFARVLRDLTVKKP